MQITALATYLVTAMTAWTPPQQHPEGATLAAQRYESIARDIATVVSDEKEAPIFQGAHGRAQTGLLLAAIASFESAYRADVDTGRVRGDHGVSWCMMQVQVWGKTAEGWTGQQLVDDRSKCLIVALHRVRQSFEACRALPLADRLSVYTSGTCRIEPQAEYRTWRAVRWFKDHPVAVEPTLPSSPRLRASGRSGALLLSLRDEISRE